MKSAKALVLVALLMCSAAISAAQSNILRTILDPGRNRTFFIPLSSNVDVLDAVNFDSNARRLVVCSRSDAEKCQAWPLEAKDVLPFSSEGPGARLFVAETATVFKLCELSGITPAARLVCKSASVADLDSGNLIAKGASSLHLKFNALDAEYDCLFSSLNGFNCSTSQRLNSRSVAGIFIADFLGSRNSVQILDLNNKAARLCEIGASCKVVEGLDLLSSAKFLAAGGYSRDGARAMLIGVSDDLNIACTLLHYSTYRIGFVCDSSVQEYPSKASVQPFSVRTAVGSTADAVVFVDRRNEAVPVAGLSDVESMPAAARTKVLMNLASRIATHVGNGASKKFTGVSSETGATISGGVTTMAIIPKENIYDFSEIQVPWLFEIAINKLLDDGFTSGERVRLDSMWSDTAGFYFTNWNLVDFGSITRPECISQCDTEKNGADDVCDAMIGLYSYAAEAAVVGATVVSAFISGPGAVAVFFAGTATVGAVSAVAGPICKGASAGERIRCYARCPPK